MECTGILEISNVTGIVYICVLYVLRNKQVKTDFLVQKCNNCSCSGNLFNQPLRKSLFQHSRSLIKNNSSHSHVNNKCN